MVSRSVSTTDATGDGSDQQIYDATGLEIIEVPNGIELTRKALRVLNSNLVTIQCRGRWGEIFFAG